MAGNAKPHVWDALLRRAKHVGIEVPKDMEPTPENVEQIKAQIQRREADNPEVTPTDDDTHVIDDTEQAVMVRVHEWTEWLPATPDPHVKGLAMSSGFTGFNTSRDERLLEVAVTGTGQKYEWDEDVDCDRCEGSGYSPDSDKSVDKRCEKCEGTGTIKERQHYGLYAFQATMAMNVSPQILATMRHVQAESMQAELARDKAKEGRDRRGDIVVVQNDRKTPRQTPLRPPNRSQRRHPGKD